MKEKFKKASSKVAKFFDKAEDVICNPFDITFTLRKKKNPEKPALTVNLKGEVSKRLILFLTILGALTTIFTIFKIARLFKK